MNNHPNVALTILLVEAFLASPTQVTDVHGVFSFIFEREPFQSILRARMISGQIEYKRHQNGDSAVENTTKVSGV